MNALNYQALGWRWLAAAALFLFGFIGLLAGTSLSERPDVVSSPWMTKAYYAMGFFVVGGLDVGTPVGGPAWARFILWIAYFGAPFLTASAVVDAVFRVLTPDRWQLRNLKNHIVIFGSGRLTLSYLRTLERAQIKHKIVIVDLEFDPVREQELKQKFNATTVVGDLTHEYLLKLLRLPKAHRVMLLGDNDFQAFEAAQRILEIAPSLRGKVTLHAHNLRFMRSLQNTTLMGAVETFNTYHLAATGFVRDYLTDHFAQTEGKDTVLIAGFGRFGQSVMEELDAIAAEEIKEVVIIDKDADRRVLVVEEQERLDRRLTPKNTFEGDISHPDVWRQVTETINLGVDHPTIILGTGNEQDNLRTALWIKAGYPDAQVFARTNDISNFVLAVGTQNGIKNISITQLVESHMPSHWFN